MQTTSDIVNGICQQLRTEEVVSPPNLRGGLLKTGAFDNTDRNSSSTTAEDTFHGTGSSLMQRVSNAKSGTDRGALVICQDDSSTKSISPFAISLHSCFNNHCPGEGIPFSL